jgi:uncharacterized protein YbjT (DUF2867 family)
VGEKTTARFMKTALLAGSTGLIGKQLLTLLLECQQYDRVIAISRNPLGQSHAKLENLVLDFNNLSENYERLKTNDVFCCLGTTMRKAGSKGAFRKVDFEYPLELAKITRNTGANQFLLVSSLGADRNSSIFYNQVKGEIEEAIGKLNFSTLHILRPSLLLGPREERRPGEDSAKIFYKLFGWAVPLKYKAIESHQVAKAMLRYAGEGRPGTFIHESIEIQRSL